MSLTNTSRLVIAAAITAALLVSGAAAVAYQDDEPKHTASDEAPQRRMSADEIPAEVLAPTQEGDGTVRSFGGFMAGVMAGIDGKPAARPTSIDGLIEHTASSARGTVAGVRLEQSEVHQGELTATRIDLVIDLDVSETLKRAPDVPDRSWYQTVWFGDPVLAPGILQKLTTELGTGPIGAEAVLFANVVEGESGAVLGIFDGLVEDATGTARLSVIADPEPKDLTSVEVVGR